jgi:hypothetical protein
LISKPPLLLDWKVLEIQQHPAQKNGLIVLQSYRFDEDLFYSNMPITPGSPTRGALCCEKIGAGRREWGIGNGE